MGGDLGRQRLPRLQDLWLNFRGRMQQADIAGDPGRRTRGSLALDGRLQQAAIAGDPRTPDVGPQDLWLWTDACRRPSQETGTT
ncbi:hypothetical protein V1264_002739 [Littorina saxatilis]|uniref:Uncharacterized protein n=1 Tax=Littorina saxatilis TaxID=31220 RepID=A0AAN9G7T0_9CAEN